MRKCNICEKEFDNHNKYANHIRWEHTKEKYSVDGLSLLKEKALLNNEKRFGKWVLEKIKCTKCDNIIDIKFREDKKKKKYYCSVSCRNSRTWSEETNKKRAKSNSIATKKLLSENSEYRDKQLQRKIFSSKGEREIIDYFKSKYLNIAWKTGGGLKCGGEIISRDLWSDSLKISLEYDGVWHFKDIHGQLEKKQYKDILLDKYCSENGFLLIRVKEEVYLSDKEKTLSLIDSLFFSNKKGVIYLYDTFSGDGGSRL